MKSSLCILASLLMGMASFVHAQSYNSAMADLTISDQSGDRDLSGFLWYPTDASEPKSSDFISKVWKGSDVIMDAVPSSGRFPLVVLSHGMYGNSYNQAWLANALARNGYVVAAVDHPGTSTWSREPEVTRQLWQRPKDVSRVIDHLTTSADIAAQIDAERIFMAGHSLGGFTAALLAGARYDADGLRRFCAKTPDELACGILFDWKIAQTEEDRVQMEADLSDPRIKAFGLFDLGGTQSFSDASLAQLSKPMLIFGAPITSSGLTLEIESRALVASVPPEIVTYIEPEDLSHFDFLGICHSGGYELLAKEEPGDEIICANGGAVRAQKHRMITQELLQFFDQH